MFCSKKGFIGVVLIAAVFAGCGQSKVEFKKEEHPVVNASSKEASPNVKDEGYTPLFQLPDEKDPDAKLKLPTPPKEDEPLHGRIFARNPKPIESMKDAFPWQRWEKMEHKGDDLLKDDELTTPGDHIKDESLKDFTDYLTLRKVSGKRCVYRNRLLEAKGELPQGITTLKGSPKEPFGNEDLLCVPMSDDIGSTVNIDILDDGAGELTKVHWIGTSAFKEAPRANGDGELNGKIQFKLTQRLAYRQGFGMAARYALADGFDTLLNVVASHSDGSLCGLERTFQLTLIFKDNKLDSGKLAVQTRHVNQDEFQGLVKDPERQTYKVEPNEMPSLNSIADRACRVQHKAWMYCAADSVDKPSDVSCDANVTKAVETNFRSLLDARMSGFGTDRLFVLNRDQANGRKVPGCSVLWHEPGLEGSSAIDINPLSLENFYKVVDIIDLEVKK